MNDLTNPVIRFRHAAAAAGITKKTLRNWIDREQVFFGQYQKPIGYPLQPERRFIATSPEPRKWQEFDLQELSVLAITAELVGYGINPRISFVTAHNAVFGATRLLASYSNFPQKALPAAFFGKVIYIHCSQQKTQVALANLDDDPPENWPQSSLLIIELHAVITAMIERLNASQVGGQNEQD